MSIEKCKLCEKDSTSWFFIHGHICQDCYMGVTSEMYFVSIIENRFPRLEFAFHNYEEAEKFCNYLNKKKHGCSSLNTIKVYDSSSQLIKNIDNSEVNNAT